MSPTFRKVALILAVLGFAVSVLVAACGNDDDETAPATATTETTATTTPPPTTTESTPTTTESQTTTTAPKPPPPEFVTVRITVEGARPVGGIARPKVARNRRVVLLVSSDVADHVHLHGYDLMADVGPGKQARISFVASVPGRFEIELEDLGVQIAELEVRP